MPDVYRPAAIDQLKTLAASIDVECYNSNEKEKPIKIAEKSIDYAKKHFFDVVIFDTAGRTAIDEKMMKEIQALHKELKPVETLFVVDSMQGQDAVNTASAFNDALELTGIVLTKVDGDSRGGAALSAKHIIGKPIKFVGVNEKINGIEPFYPDRLASRILEWVILLAWLRKLKKTLTKKKHKS